MGEAKLGIVIVCAFILGVLVTLIVRGF